MGDEEAMDERRGMKEEYGDKKLEARDQKSEVRSKQ